MDCDVFPTTLRICEDGGGVNSLVCCDGGDVGTRSSVRELAFGAAVEGAFGEGVRGIDTVDIVTSEYYPGAPKL